MDSRMGGTSMEVEMETDPIKAKPICRLCGKTESQMLPAVFVRTPIAQEIRKHHPDWKPEGYICQTDLNRFRFEYIQSLLESEKGELSSLDQEVLESLKHHETLTSDTDAECEKELTLVAIQQVQLDVLSELSRLRDQGSDR